MKAMKYESENDVLRAALDLHGQHDEPTSREVLGIQIRAMCARNGMPKPDFNHFPPSELADHYFGTKGG